MYMKNYKLERQYNESIVDGIIEGYKSYLEVRKSVAKKLRIHGAYAWVKGNHIDHYVAEHCEPLGIESKISRAGVTWQYLQFTNAENNSLFLIRNAMYFNENSVTKGKDAHGKTRNNKSIYMNELMKINNDVNFTAIEEQMNNPISKQLTLFDENRMEVISREEISGITSEYDKFYIVTYSIDENHLISQIKLWMPNPHDNKAYLIDDLTGLIGMNPSHDIPLEEETIAILDSTAEQQNLNAINYGIVLPEESVSQDS